MPVARRLAKVISGGGRSLSVPNNWQQSTYGPGQPLWPTTPERDTEIPRSIDYPISVNSFLTPRTGYDLMPFAQLLSAYEHIPECRTPVSLIHRELSSFIPHLIDKGGNTIEDHPYQWMCDYPDGITPFSVWMTRYLKSAKVYDAPALYLERDGNGDIQALDYIDGSTLFVIVDERGNIPRPEPIPAYFDRVRQLPNNVSTNQLMIPGSVSGPSTATQFQDTYNRRFYNKQSVPVKVPAYTQVIKGTPFAWWAADDIWYVPQSPRMNSPYGSPFIEAVWPWIMIIVNVVTFELAHYRTGNMPEGFVTLPRDWLSNPTQLQALEDAFNKRMSSNPATERQRLRLFPDGATWQETKKADWPDSLYKQGWNAILNEIGIPPSEYGDVPGQGLGGKGFKAGSESTLSRQTIDPHRKTVAEPFNYALRANGVTDVHFSLDYPITEIDPDKLKQSIFDGMAHGTLSLNDGRRQLNMKPIGDPDDDSNIANKHLIVAGATIYVIEDMKEQGGVAEPSFGGTSPSGTPPADGKTGGPPKTTSGLKKYEVEHILSDRETLEKILRNLEERGTLDEKFISVSLAKSNPNHDERGRFSTGGSSGANVYKELGTNGDKKLCSTEGSKWKAKLSSDEQDEVYEYTSGGIEDTYINDHLRGDVPIDSHAEERISRLDSALSKGAMDENRLVYRAVADDTLGVRKLSSGESFIDPGYASTTLSTDQALGFAGGDMLLHISVPKGTPGGYVDKLTDWPEQQEFLLARGLKYNVDSVSTDEEGLAHVYCHI